MPGVLPLALILCGGSVVAQTPGAELPQAPVPNVPKLPGGVTVERRDPGCVAVESG